MSAYCNDAILSAMAAQITSLMIVYSAVYSGADQRKDQSSVSLVSVSGIYRWPVNSPHKGPVTRKMFPLDDGIMRELGYSDMFVLKLINHDFQTSYLIGWQHGPQAIRSHVRKSALVLTWIVLVILAPDQFHATRHTWYRQVSNISRTLVDNKIVDHSDVVGASPVGAAPTTSSFST